MTEIWKRRDSGRHNVSMVRQQEAGKPVKDICPEHGTSDAEFYNWKTRYGGMAVVV